MKEAIAILTGGGPAPGMNTAWLACQLSDFLWILQNWKVERSCFKNGRLDEESSKSHPLYL